MKLNLLSQKIQQKIVKTEAQGHPGADREVLQRKQVERYGTPEKRNVRIILTKTEAQAKQAKKEIESGKSFASVAKSRLDRPDQQGQRRPAQRKSSRARRRRRSTAAIFSAKKTCSAAR